ncbi:MAG: hypothetical protein WA880_03115 [Ornithinimicrobium sp.]
MSRRLSPRSYGAFALAIALSLSACSGTESDEAQSSSSTDDTAATAGDGAEATEDIAESTGDGAASTGESAGASSGPALSLTASDDAFTLEVPQGWSDAIDLVPANAILAAQSDTRSSGFFNNVVITDQESVADLEEAVAETAKVLASDDTEVTELDPVDVDGEDAYGYATISQSDGITLAQEQRFVQRDDTQYVITFSTSQGEGEDNNAANKELDAILESWEWADSQS